MASTSSADPEQSGRSDVSTTTRDGSRSKISFKLGLTECVLGGICMISGFLMLIPAFMDDIGRDCDQTYTYTCQGVWAGILMIFSGRMTMSMTTNTSRNQATSFYCLVIGCITLLALFAMVPLSCLAASAYDQHISLIVSHGIVAAIGVIGICIRISLIFPLLYVCLYVYGITNY